MRKCGDNRSDGSAGPNSLGDEIGVGVAFPAPGFRGRQQLAYQLVVQRVARLHRVISAGDRGACPPSEDNHLTVRARIEYDNNVIGVQQMAVRLAPGTMSSR